MPTVRRIARLSAALAVAMGMLLSATSTAAQAADDGAPWPFPGTAGPPSGSVRINAVQAANGLIIRNSGDTCWLTAMRAASPTNDRFVSSEWGWTGSIRGGLRARSHGVGVWEQHALCRDSATGAYYLEARDDPDANGAGPYRVVSADYNLQGSSHGMLVANRGAVDRWELFFLEGLGGDVYALRSWEGKRVASEEGWSGHVQYTLVARTTTAAGPWERFRFYNYGQIYP